MLLAYIRKFWLKLGATDLSNICLIVKLGSLISHSEISISNLKCFLLSNIFHIKGGQTRCGKFPHNFFFLKASLTTNIIFPDVCVRSSNIVIKTLFILILEVNYLVQVSF